MLESAATSAPSDRGHSRDHSGAGSGAIARKSPHAVALAGMVIVRRAQDGGGVAAWLPSLDQVRKGLAASGQSQIACFVSQPESASFPKFDSWIYALDALIPGLQTGQRDHWSPDTRFTLGQVLYHPLSA